jgi:hypothetical protein
MNIYHYHPETKRYCGIDVADESPLEQGVFLIPACATSVEPPQCGENEMVVFGNGEWNVVQIPEPEPIPEPEETVDRVGLIGQQLTDLITTLIELEVI